VPRQRGPAAAGEQDEPVIQALGELGWRQRGQPNGRQLDGQRHPVQRPADPGHGGRIARIELEVRPDGCRPVTQQPDRGVGLVGPFGIRQRGHGQRRDRAQGLTVDAERLPAGGHDPHPRAGGQDRARERGGRLDDMLAVIEDDDVVPVSQRRGQPIQRARPGIARPARDDALADAERVEDRVRHLGRIGHRRELDEPGSSGQPPRHLGGQPRLAHSPGAGEGDQACRVQVLQDPGHLDVPAHEAGQRVRDPGRDRCAGGGAHGPFRIKGMIPGTGGAFGYGGRPFLAAEDTQVDLLELSRWVDAEPSREQLPSLVVNLERLGLPARRVQRAHEQGTGALGQRVARHQGAELADEAGSLPEGQVGLDAVGQRAGAQLGQPGRGDVGEVAPGRVGERLAAPRGQRGSQDPRGLLKVTAGQRAAAPDGERLEGHRVYSVRRHHQPVPGRVRFDHVINPGAAEFGPQPGDQRLQGVTGVGRQLTGPDLLGQRG